MTTNYASTCWKYANLQMAAESLFGVLVTDASGTLRGSGSMTPGSLMLGNNRTSSFPEILAKQFIDAGWTVVEHISNTPTGFSGTLFKNNATGELVLSFRSTEFADDAARDNQATNSLEIKDKGWAFGQIADMEQWFSSLKSSGTLDPATPITVTGYSLGGHLATAFNLLHQNDLTAFGAPLISATYTFNGAGVGLVTDGRTLSQVLAEFTTRNQINANADLFAEASARDAYNQLRVLFSGHTAVNSGDVQMAFDLIASRLANATEAAKNQLSILNSAMQRVGSVVAEAERVNAGIGSGGAGASATAISTVQIAACGLDYQLAVLQAGAHTKSTRTVFDESGVVAYSGREIASPSIATLFDVYGDTSPSGVANSQIHYGTPTPIWIEDQPLLRGAIIPGVAAATGLGGVVSGDFKLLVNGFSKNDFGDTHSLVLMVDSLSVQNAMAQLDSTLDAAKIKAIFDAGSYLMSVTGFTSTVGPDNQGGADGDSLESVIRSLAAFCGLSLETDLNGSMWGGTWADMSDRADGTAGRTTFYQRLTDVVTSSAYQSLVGKVVLQPITQDMVRSLATQAKARVDFETLVALETLSPFVVNPVGAEGQVALESLWQSASWNPIYQAWRADKDSMQTGDEAENFTDEYLQDRALLVQGLLARNVANITDPVVDCLTAPTDRLIDFQYHEVDVESPTQFTLWNPQSGLTPLLHTRQIIDFGSELDDSITGTGEIQFGDHLYGAGGNDIMSGLAGDDYLEGNTGNDSLDGGDGVDTLLGGAGEDTLIGGEGHDILLGGAGQDTYYFEGNIGLDIVRDSDGAGRIVVGSSGSAPLSGGKKLAENVWISDDKRFTYVLLEGKLIIHPGDASGASGFITVKDWTAGQLGITLSDTPATSTSPSTTFDGDFVKLKNEAQTQYVLGGDGNYQGAGLQSGALDLITGTTGSDAIAGLAGNDALLGRAGDDLIDGGTGDDILMGGLGADTLNGGTGNDLIYGSSSGSLQYPLTDGWTLYDADLIVLAEGWDWRSYTDGSSDIWGVQRQLLSPTVLRDEQFGDAGNVIDGGSGDDRIYAGTGNDAVHAGADDDYIVGMGGHEVLFGDEGNDVILGDGTVAPDPVTSTPAQAHGNDVLIGGDGKDVLIGQGASDVLMGGAGKDVLHGDDYDDARTPLAIHGDDLLDGGDDDDVLYGGGGDDILIGGEGNDYLVGGSGRDIYIFNKGDGVDWIVDNPGDNNIIRFGAGVNKDDIKLRLGSLLVDLGSGDQLHIDGFNQDDARNSVSVEAFEFADGSVLTPSALLDRGFDLVGDFRDQTIRGTSVDDRISGFAGDDVLSGLAGDDWMDGGDGNDTLIAGTGADTLIGGAGDDLFVIESGVGTVTVVAGEGADVIAFGSGISLDTLSCAVNGDSLVLTLEGGATVSVAGSASYRFFDGTTLDSQAMIDRLLTPPPAPGPQYRSTTTNLFDAAGNPIGSSVKVADENGTMTTIFSGPDGTGKKVNDTWTTVRGGYGSDTFNADGSSSGIAFHVDGTHDTYTADGLGGRLQTIFSVAGDITGDSWTRADGSFGDDLFYGNGASSGTIHRPDGTYDLYTNDGHGHIATTTYDAQGAVLTVTQTDDGQSYPITSTTQLADGTYRVTVVQGPGTSTSTLFSETGLKLSTSWVKADGAHGSEALDADGSTTGIAYAADGSYKMLQKDGLGQTITKTFNWNGESMGSTITEVNGLNTITTYTNASGAKIGEVWTHADGTSGADVVGPMDFFGAENMLAQSTTRSLVGDFNWESDDGEIGGSFGGGHQSSGFSLSGDGFSFFTPSGVYGYRDRQLAEAQDGSGFAGSTKLEFDADSWLMLKRSFQSAPFGGFGLGDSERGVYYFYDSTTSISVRGLEASDGTKSLNFSLNSTEDQDVPILALQTPYSRTVQGNAGTYAVFRDDGQGNVELTSYHPDGTPIDETWFHNDGSDGIDLYGADGSVEGFIANADGTSINYTRDSLGHIERTIYPGAFPLVPTRVQVPSTISIPGAQGSLIAAPAGGLLVSPTTTSQTADGGSIVTTSVACDEKTTTYSATGEIISVRVVHTDPGYAAAVTVNGGFAGWDYDPAGVPTSRYTDNGQGRVETCAYDAQGRVTRREVAITASDGSVNTTRYSANGQLTGASIQTPPAAGESTVTNYDAAGRLLGSSVEYADGRGNSVVSHYDAAGALLSFTTKVVAASGDETTIASYDAAGVATGLIVTATTPEGIVQTDTYDAGGVLMGSVVATPDGNGKVTTANYDASGALTSFVTLRTDEAGATLLTTFDASARRLREDKLQLDGLHASTDYDADGSTLTTIVELDGAFSTVERDGAGTVTSTRYNAAGTKLASAWTCGDGSHGSDTFAIDGSSVGDAYYADGTHSESVTTADGQVTIARYSVDGKLTGTTGSPNHAPTVVQPIEAQATQQDQPWTFTIPAGTFADPDEDSLTYSASTAGGQPLPAWLQFDSATFTFTGTPGNDGVGGLALEVTVADGSDAMASTTIALNVTNVNDAPALVNAVSAQSATEGQPWRFTVPVDTFSDQDVGDTLTYAATLADGSPLPSWLSFDAGTRTFSGTPLRSDGGEVMMEIIATDNGGLTARQTVALHVSMATYADPGSNLLGTIGKDTLIGGAGNDFLDGLSGADQMIGHEGDDTYTVDTPKDVVVELASEGFDTVRSSVTYTLPANVEALVLTGTADRNGTGNASDNTLVGNAGRNILKGGAGHDTYVMTRGSGADKIQENDATLGNTDVALFTDIASDQLWFQHRGRDLQVTVIGTSDKLTIANWFAGTQYHVEQFKTSDGKTLLDSQVQNLVDAMAGFAPPAAGQTTLSPSYQSRLGGVIAANWQ